VSEMCGRIRSRLGGEYRWTVYLKLVSNIRASRKVRHCAALLVNPKRCPPIPIFLIFIYLVVDVIC